MNVAEARRTGAARLAGTETARLDADVLLAWVLDVRRESLFAHPEAFLEPDQAREYEGLVARRMAGEPVAYLTGLKSWFGLDLRVTRDVLIPRPETELLVELAIKLAKEKRARLIVDVGTGSGAIAIALAKALQQVEVIATDLSPASLEVARLNVEALAMGDRISITGGDLLEAVQAEPDLVVANLPYVPDGDWPELSPEVRSEPRLAFLGGPDGLDVIRRLLVQLRERRWLVPVVLELDPRQVESVRTFVEANGAWVVEIAPDLAGRERIAILRPPRIGHDRAVDER